MSAAEYWFARRYPVGHQSQSYGPVHWKGWAVTGVFVAVLSTGGMAFAWLGASGQMIEGVAIFALAALAGGGGFISIASAKTDKTRTVADYRKEAARV
jgi:hypothetical protein